MVCWLCVAHTQPCAHKYKHILLCPPQAVGRWGRQVHLHGDGMNGMLHERRDAEWKREKERGGRRREQVLDGQSGKRGDTERGTVQKKGQQGEGWMNGESVWGGWGAGRSVTLVLSQFSQAGHFLPWIPLGYLVVFASFSYSFSSLVVSHCRNPQSDAPFAFLVEHWWICDRSVSRLLMPLTLFGKQ